MRKRSVRRRNSMRSSSATRTKVKSSEHALQSVLEMQVKRNQNMQSGKEEEGKKVARMCVKKTASVGRKSSSFSTFLKKPEKADIRTLCLLCPPACPRNTAVRTSVPHRACFPFGTYHIVAKLDSLSVQENNGHLSTHREN